MVFASYWETVVCVFCVKCVMLFLRNIQIYFIYLSIKSRQHEYVYDF